jgi:hypothetical protein
MRKFILNISIFCLIIIGLHLLFAFFADGSTDTSYLRFTSEKQSCLIIGDSRSSQGIIPDAFDSITPNNEKMYNFSFTINNSPFGEVYLNAIKNKLDISSKNSLFIISVTPWALLEDTSVRLEHDKNSILFEMNSFNSKPNIEYLYKNYKYGWGRIILDRISKYILEKYSTKMSNINGSWSFLHTNGWLEVFTNMNEKHVEINTNKKIQSYINTMSNKSFSEYRYNYLKETINYLNNFGEVYIVRLPVHYSLLEIENDINPNFDDLINKINNVKYINLKNESKLYKYTDGNHLYKKSALIVSKKIADKILELRK